MLMFPSTAKHEINGKIGNGGTDFWQQFNEVGSLCYKSDLFVAFERAPCHSY